MTAPYYEDESVRLFLGDCLDVLSELPDNSVDSICTDPPYGLGFMGKAWDELPPGLPWAQECLRVLKPGGHLLAFGGTRTWHRLAVAVEDAGFEVRDSIAWLYGSGFPKSLDVSKAIDKRRVEDQEPTRVVCRAIRAAMDADGLKSRDLVPHFDGCHPRLIDHWAARDTDSQPSLPTWEQWETLRRVLSALGEALDAEVWRLNGRKGTPGEAWDAREVISERPAFGIGGNGVLGGHAEGATAKVVGASVNDAAAHWQGWGTALKPAFEPIVVARKPLVGTVAANVLAHGTGALNVDGCRVQAGQDYRDKCASVVGLDSNRNGDAYGEWSGVREDSSHVAGRWPANVLLDGSQADALDEQSGTLRARGNINPTAGGGGMYGHERTTVDHGRGEEGGASRFFPVFADDGHLSPDRLRGRSGVPAAEGAGSDAGSGEAVRASLRHSGTAEAALDLPTFRYQAKAPTRERVKVEGIAHPTVKPLELMRWLVRLVTPPGGVVLEPFAGSGTTVEAALLEGFRCIAIEREADYLPLILARLERNRPEPETPTAVIADALALFDLEEPA